ncbi:MAG: glycosyl hydrolase 2 galactose-binding domain-containing protein [Verrucomicrobiota bacterium]
MMRTLPLNGNWTLRRDDDPADIPASVPGNVHLDLLADGRLEDPYYCEQELDAQWVAECGWTFGRSFVVPPEMLARENLRLRCRGLDTFATVRVNGEAIARVDDRRYRVSLAARRPALWAWLELEGADARYSDNFICLRPGVPRTIEVRPAAPTEERDFAAALKVRSIFELGADLNES